jgi:hypothetical protein
MKYESDGGPGMRDILRVLDASLAADMTELVRRLANDQL